MIWWPLIIFIIHTLFPFLINNYFITTAAPDEKKKKKKLKKCFFSSFFFFFFSNTFTTIPVLDHYYSHNVSQNVFDQNITTVSELTIPFQLNIIANPGVTLKWSTYIPVSTSAELSPFFSWGQLSASRHCIFILERFCLGRDLVF